MSASSYISFDHVIDPGGVGVGAPVSRVNQPHSSLECARSVCVR